MVTPIKGTIGTKRYYSINPRSIIVKDGWNPRKDFGDMESLTNSIISNGIKIPISVKPLGDDTFQLLDGHRRLRACLEAIKQGHEILSIPAIIEKRNISNDDALIGMLISNDGKRFDAIEEAETYKRLVGYGWKQKDIAERIGKSTAHISQCLELLNASKPLQDAVKKKEIPVTTARNIIKSTNGDMEKEKELTEKVKSGNEGKKEVKKITMNPKKKEIAEAKETLKKDINNYIDKMQHMDEDESFSSDHFHGKTIKELFERVIKVL